ncbi:MAG: proline racemase family protein, partial [Pseudomonadota bacterium]|nr:proline racemase family protein [Pseudomonadota bacterium]
DVAYGGNWFFLVDPSPLAVEAGNIPALTDFSIRVREAANAQGAVGENGELIDHVVLLGGADAPGVHGRNFVLTPDNTYDRSPCGTGCSARLACLAADQRLAPGDEIVQESVIGSRYRLSYQPGTSGGVIPRITGQAHVMAESRLIFADADPFHAGIAPSSPGTSPQPPHG